MAEVKGLHIKITSESTQAVNGLKALHESLEKIKQSTKGGLGLTSVANQIGKVADESNKISNITISNLKGFAEAVKTLSGVSNIKISASIANQISAINTALSGLNIGDGGDKIAKLVSALRPLETLGKSSLSTTVNALNKLPEALQKIDTQKLYGQISSLTRIMKPLADEMQKVANGFNAFPSRIQKLIQENDKLTHSHKRLSTTYTEMYSKLRMAYSAIKTLTKGIASCIKQSTEYIENVNLFNVAMGEYRDEAREYAETVGDAFGIDPGEWMRNQATFMTLATGFGVVGDRANIMSQNLTQLGYDLSSFFNLPYEDMMQKLQSGLAGELEPLRRIGFDLSVARLQQEAYALGINKKVSAMTQAEKAELRYHAILTQVTTAQGDMARTLEQPANQLRVLKAQINQAGRAIGNIFIPMLKVVLPYLIAFAKVVKTVADGIAKLFGYVEETADLSNMGSLASGADEYSSALGSAVDNAKKLQKYTMGFDELNVIDPNQGSGDSGAGGIGGVGFDFDLKELEKITKEFKTKAEEIYSNLTLSFKDIFVDWKDLTGEQIAKKITTGLLMLSGGVIGFSMGGFGGALLGITIGAGLGLLISAISIDNDGKLSSGELMKIIGDSLIAIGTGVGLKFGGWKGGLLALTMGVSVELGIKSIKSMMSEGVNGQNITQLILSALGITGSIIGAIKVFNSKHKSPIPDLDTAGKTIGETAKGTSKLTGELQNLTKNLGLGIAIIAEVVVAVALFIGGIWLIGKLLDETGKAWQPVIDNGGTVAIAMGIGTAILVAVGVATAYLGTLGGVMCGQIGIGIAILAELGVATALFLAEIWVVGTLLNEIGNAWQPVLDNGGTIAKGIGIGTGLLVAIGVVTALLGSATVASAGALPIAIGLGTAILIELGIAFVEFCDSLIKVADKLSDDLHPALKDLNKILPDLNTNMKDFTKFMGEFADMTVEYTKNSAISGFSATVDSIVKFFTKDPIKSLANDVDKQYKQSVKLNEKLNLANPEISTAITELGTYKTRIDTLKGVADTIDTSEMGMSGFTNLVTIGGKIAEFGGKMKAYYDKIKNIKVDTMDNMVSCINDVIDFAVRIKDEVEINKINLFTEAIENLTKAVKALPTSKTLTITAIYKTQGTAPQQYATGGFPETGQMFIAREAGAELVGNIGRKTAVVNNEQIVASVSKGVVEANSESNSLLREQNSLLKALLEKESGVYLDGKRLTNSVEKYQSQRGRTIVVGGAV